MPKYDVTKKFIDNLREGKVSRRSFVKGMGAAGVLGLTSGLVPATNAFASTGRAFVWGGYDDDGLFGPYVEAHELQHMAQIDHRHHNRPKQKHVQ